jgi:hypothetical protein
VLRILSLFRDQSQGKHINGDLLAMRNTVEQCMPGGVWDEQMDPVLMLKQVASCAESWDNYFNTVLSKTGGNSGVVSGGASASGSGGGGQRPCKRLFTAVTPPNGATMQGATEQTSFDPFVSIPNQCLVNRDDNNRTWFIRGLNHTEMDSLMKAGKCVLCKQSWHLRAACPNRQDMFASKKFYFHPTKK